MKNRIIESAILAFGLLMLGLFIQNGTKSFAQRDRAVSVKGLAEKEVQADRVIWPLPFKEVGDDLQLLYNSLETKNKTVVTFLKSNGVKDDEISISAPVVFDKDAERYGGTNTSPYRYNATSVITVTSNQVDLVRRLMTEQGSLLKQGIAITGGDYDYRTEFLFTKLNEIKPQMIEEATKNAREAAVKFAEDSKSKLGKIKSANQGQFSISERDANSPYIKNVRVVSTVEYYLKD